MGYSLVENIIDALRISGVRADRACPGKRMPEIQSVAAAVQLAKLDRKEATATVLVSVLAPKTAGAAEAEDAAIRICRLLEYEGGDSRLEKTEYLNGPECFCTEVYATFFGRENASGWIPIFPEESDPEETPAFFVAVNGVNHPYVVSFRGFRQVDENAMSIDDTPWCFRMEEVYPMEIPEKTMPISNFSLEVTRAAGMERFTGCVLTSHTREWRMDGQHQIWEGTASCMTVSGFSVQ